MYGPPPICKRKSVRDKAVCVNVSGLWLEFLLRAAMMIRRVPVLLTRSVVEDLSLTQVFWHAVRLLSRPGFPSADLGSLVLVFPQQTSVEVSLKSRSRAVENVWSAARLQAESLSWVVWSAQMYPACLWS